MIEHSGLGALAPEKDADGAVLGGAHRRQVACASLRRMPAVILPADARVSTMWFDGRHPCTV